MRGMAFPARVQTLVRIDLRRPAAWFSLVMALVAAATLPVAWGGTLAPAMAIACGGLAAVAAVGGQGGCGPGSAAISIGRVAWPIGGAVAGTVVAWIMAPAPVVWQTGTALVAAVSATGWAEFRGRCSGCTPSQAASLALSMAAAAALAAGIPDSPAASAIASMMCWAALATTAFAIVLPRRSGDPVSALMPARRWHRAASVHHLDAPHRAVAGSFLDPLAMASTLVAMVVCYFLAPDHARWFVAVSAAWFTVLAVPAATIAAGALDADRRGLLARSAPGGPRLPGSFRHALAALGLHAAIFGWPAVVAAVLWGAAAATPCGPLTAVVVLAALAGSVVLVVAVMDEMVRRGCRGADGGAALALAMAAAMAVLLATGLLLPDCPSLRSSARCLAGVSLDSRC